MARASILRQISDGLHVLEDTCNSYLVRRGDAGLLVDSGSGAIAGFLAGAGVRSLEWILHTHHHRDQCWGTPGLVSDFGARVAAPAYERYLFESAREHWQTKRIFDNYADSNTFFAPGADIAVDAVLDDYESFAWRELEFAVLPAQGHTFGSSALVVEIDGRRVAFTGDLMAAGGLLYQLHALEYNYGDLAGVLFTLQSLQALRRAEPELVLPSHGAVIEDPAGDIERLEARLMDIAGLGSGIGAASEGWLDPPASMILPEPPLIQVSEHLLWGGPSTCSNFYVVLSGTGEALLVDYGHGHYANMHVDMDQQSHESMRFVVHHLDELQERFGVTAIEAVAVTHIHDDHVCGVPYLQRHHNAECWALDVVADVLEAPAEWASTPCTFPRSIAVSRRLADGESVQWRGYELTFHFAPGQTEFHSVISAEIDGRTVAFTGDNLFLANVEAAGEVVLRPIQTTVFRNSFQLAMHRRCVEVMREISPDLICPGHLDLIPCDDDAIARYADYVAEKERVFRSAVADPADHYLDLFWARLRPYFKPVEGGERIEYTLMLRNNLGRSASFEARLISPSGWGDANGAGRISLAEGERGEIGLALQAPPVLGPGRTLITAEVLIDGVSQGPIAEALVTA